ncbi:MAG: hypothetical protein AAGF30_09540 [Pseudomonadota bacterium]
MPRIVRFYIRCVATGFFVAALFTGLVIWLNIANLGHLFLTSDKAFIAIPAFWILNGIVFTGVQAVWVVMQMAEDE